MNDWADSFGITHPVVKDPGFNVTLRYIQTTGGSFGIPSMTLLQDGAEIVITDGYVDEGTVQSYLP